MANEVETDEAAKEARALEVLDMAKNWKVSERTDDYRDENAGYYGGFQLTDPELTNRLRSAAKELILMAGKKILNGEFNLTRISFPIKCMCSMSVM